MSNKKTKKSKKPKTTFKEIEFDFHKLFPPESKLGREILSLMAALNDAAFLREFSRTLKKTHGKAVPEAVFSCGKMFFLIRLMCAGLFEAIEIVERISTSPKYKDHLNLVTNEGHQALKRLLDFKETETGKKFEKARNKITFHYDCSFLAEGLCSLKKNFEEEKNSIVEITKRKKGTNEHNETSFYYSFADIVRQESVFGLLKSGAMEEIVKKQLQIERDLGIFFSSLFNVYQEKGNFYAFNKNSNYLLEPL